MRAVMPIAKSHKPVKRKPSRRHSGPSKPAKLPKNAVTLIVVLRAREGQQLLLEAELRALIAPSRKEEGCLQYDLHRSVEQPGTFLFHEIWASKDHLTAHTRTDHYLRFNARKDALLASRESGFWQQLA